MSRPQEELSRGESVEVAQKDGESTSGEALPKGWAEAPLFDLCRPKQHPTIATKKLSEFGYPVYGANGKIGFHTEFTHEEPTILVTCRGATCGTLNVCEPKSWVNGNAMALDDLEVEAIQFEYAYFALKNRGFEDETSGSAQPQITRAGLEPVTIPLAPKAEQSRIVSAIESLQERSSRARVLLSEVGPLIGQLRQSVLRDAFSGKLTADWRARRRMGTPESPSPPAPSKENSGIRAQATNPAQETASELLLRIRTERRERWEAEQLAKYEAKGKQPPKNWQDKYKKPEPVDESELHELPDGWCWAAAGDLCECIVPNRDKPKSFTGDIPWITMPDLDENDIDVERSADGLRLTKQETEEFKARVIPSDSVIMSCIGRFGIVAVTAREVVINQQLHAFKIPEGLNARYLAYAIKDQVEYMESISTSTTIAYLNKSNCNSVPVALAPTEEQDEIVRVIDESFDVMESISAWRASMESSLTQLDQSVLSKAFRGKLVPQDPTEEPASELLARIRTTRKTAEAKKLAAKSAKKKKPAKKKAKKKTARKRAVKT